MQYPRVERMNEKTLIKPGCPPEPMMTRQENKQENREANNNASSKIKKVSPVKIRLHPEISEIMNVNSGDIFQLSELLIMVDYALMSDNAKRLRQLRERRSLVVA